MPNTVRPTRMDAVQAAIVPYISRLIEQAPGTISLGQGVVRYGPPPAVAAALRAALDDPAMHGYQSGAGDPALLRLIGAKLQAENGIDVGRGQRVMVTAGANMAFAHAISAITAPGDEIILNLPYYFNHEMAVRMAGCVPVGVATDDRFQPRPEALRAAITARTRAIVTVSPNNPTGAVYTEDVLRAVSEICREQGLYHLNDEVYEYFTYGAARHFSPASTAGAEVSTISIYSLSKAYGFAGWRIGYMAYPQHLESALAKIQDTVLVCPPVASQIAARAAMEAGRAYCEPRVRELSEVRDQVLARLATLAPRVQVPAAAGAFYCLLRVDTALDAMTLAERLIHDWRVAVLPGPAFGLDAGCYLRVAYGALDKDAVEVGIGRLVDGLRALA